MGVFGFWVEVKYGNVVDKNVGRRREGGQEKIQSLLPRERPRLCSSLRSLHICFRCFADFWFRFVFRGVVSVKSSVV